VVSLQWLIFPDLKRKTSDRIRLSTGVNKSVYEE
jgi:hypothetical protein